MKPTVENFEILGLFGGKDVKLSFTNKVQIYIGENGLGKTTVLNTLYYLLSLKFEELKLGLMKKTIVLQKPIYKDM